MHASSESSCGPLKPKMWQLGGVCLSQTHVKAYAADKALPVSDNSYTSKRKEKPGNNINSKKALCASQLQ